LKLVKVKIKKPLRQQIKSPIGTVFCLALPDGSMAALKFVGLRPVGKVAYAVFHVLPWRGKGMPSAAALEAVSDQAVVVWDCQEFSILMDGRKSPTACLLETDIVLAHTAPLDYSYGRGAPICGLPQAVQEGLALL
jgi:hypothetical protein